MAEDAVINVVVNTDALERLDHGDFPGQEGGGHRTPPGRVPLSANPTHRGARPAAGPSQSMENARRQGRRVSEGVRKDRIERRSSIQKRRKESPTQLALQAKRAASKSAAGGILKTGIEALQIRGAFELVTAKRLPGLAARAGLVAGAIASPELAGAAGGLAGRFGAPSILGDIFGGISDFAEFATGEAFGRIKSTFDEMRVAQAHSVLGMNGDSNAGLFRDANRAFERQAASARAFAADRFAHNVDVKKITKDLATAMFGIDTDRLKRQWKKAGGASGILETVVDGLKHVPKLFRG